MKKIPESFELTQEDLKEAITYWLNHEHNVDPDFEVDFDIEFAVTTHHEPSKMAGGMADPIVTQVISAKATKVD